ncbi:MAG: hypothetical protein IT305_11555 [Chloroflexi bacterium]|nr:hypothetical protein [Chloroflexota bacterium]
MRASTSARGPLPRVTGIIDTLSAGFGVVNQQPWIVIVPVLLDLFFLFGPRISVAPLVSRLVTSTTFGRSLASSGASIDRTQVIAAAEDINLLTLLSPGSVSVPSIVPLLGISRGTFSFVDSASTALLMAVGALLGGVLIGCMYRAALAQQVRGNGITPAPLAGEALRAWLRIVALGLILLIAALAIMVPLAFAGALLSLLIGQAAVLLTAFVVTLGLWAQIFLFFAPDAIFISQVGPLQAIRRSIAVVRLNVWAAATIVVLITVILIGMAQVWVALASQTSWGLALGIVGNAYIASGLVAASMLYYQERIDVLEDARACSAR